MKLLWNQHMFIVNILETTEKYKENLILHATA